MSLLSQGTLGDNMDSIEVRDSLDGADEEEKKVTTANAGAAKPNYYKDMGLLDTSILKKIADNVGFQLGKKGKNNSSPKAGSKNKSGGKSNTAKKRTGQSAAMDMATSVYTKQFCIDKPIMEPMFRYIPDRATIQRLITRASNMKDDLAEFDLYLSAEDAAAG